MPCAETLRHRAAILLSEALRETYPLHRHSLLLEAGKMNLRALRARLNERGRDHSARRQSTLELSTPA